MLATRMLTRCLAPDSHSAEVVAAKILIRAKPPHTSDGAPAHLQTSPRGHGPPQRARGTPAQKQATHAASSNSPDASRHVARAGVHVATTPARPGPRHPPPRPTWTPRSLSRRTTTCTRTRNRSAVIFRAKFLPHPVRSHTAPIHASETQKSMCSSPVAH